MVQVSPERSTLYLHDINLDGRAKGDYFDLLAWDPDHWTGSHVRPARSSSSVEEFSHTSVGSLEQQRYY